MPVLLRVLTHMRRPSDLGTLAPRGESIYEGCMLRTVFVFAIATLGLSLPGAVSLAQDKAPGSAARTRAAAPEPYVLRDRAALEQLTRTLAAGKAENLVTPTVAVPLEMVVRHEKDQAQTEREVHAAKDHVFYILDGATKVGIGGELDAPREISPGEWRSTKSKGSKLLDLKKGDLVFIPQGTVHWRDCLGSEASVLMLSFWPRGLPAPAAAPTAPPTALPKK